MINFVTASLTIMIMGSKSDNNHSINSNNMNDSKVTENYSITIAIVALPDRGVQYVGGSKKRKLSKNT